MTIIPTPFPLFLEKDHHQPSLDPKKRLGNPFFSQFCSECPSSSILMGPKTLDLRWWDRGATNNHPKVDKDPHAEPPQKMLTFPWHRFLLFFQDTVKQGMIDEPTEANRKA